MLFSSTCSVARNICRMAKLVGSYIVIGCLFVRKRVIGWKACKEASDWAIVQVVEVPAGGELLNIVRDIDILPGFRLEGYPNRDSTGYLSLYGIESASSILRGTLRYKVRVT